MAAQAVSVQDVVTDLRALVHGSKGT
jgi:hypothetical protein